MTRNLGTILILLAIPMLALSACGDEGPAEKAGNAIDRAAQSVADTINPPGPLEQAGRMIDKAVK